MDIYCCECENAVPTEDVDGLSLYPHRPDLAYKRFYMCPACEAFVGCHPGTSVPLGTLAGPRLRFHRSLLHSALDPMWRNGARKRKDVYAAISAKLGYEFHIGEVCTVEDAQRILKIISEMEGET